MKPCFSHFQTFKRDGNDLFINHKIGLVEALCGCQFLIKHLDGRQIVVKYPAGKVIEPGQLSLAPLKYYQRIWKNSVTSSWDPVTHFCPFWQMWSAVIYMRHSSTYSFNHRWLNGCLCHVHGRVVPFLVGILFKVKVELRPHPLLTS